MRNLLRDPDLRRAYILTKLAVLAGAALATWPLSLVIGIKAWYALAVFAGVIGLLSAVVLLLGCSATRSSTDSDEAEDQDEGDEDDEDDEEEYDPEQAVVVPLADSIDLHTFAPREIPDAVQAYIEAVHASGFDEVRLIHGRGIGVQRERVRSLLARNPLVRAFHDAPPGRGGWGATVAYLNPDNQP